MALSIESDETSTVELHDRLRKDVRVWQREHRGHTAASRPASPLGFNTNAVASTFNDGEDDGWDDE